MLVNGWAQHFTMFKRLTGKKASPGPSPAPSPTKTSAEVASKQPPEKSPKSEVPPATAPVEAKPAEPTVVSPVPASPTPSAAASPTWTDAPPQQAEALPTLKVEAQGSSKAATSLWVAVAYILVAVLVIYSPPLRRCLPPALLPYLGVKSTGASSSSSAPLVKLTATSAYTGTSFSLPSSKAFSGSKLTLKAAGMRKKLFISVYSVGLYVSEGKAKDLFAKKTTAARLDSLAEGGAALLLQFQRDVETGKVVDAFMKALAQKSGDSTYNKDKTKLQDILTSAVSKAGKYKKKDTIEFFFDGKSKLGVTVNGGKRQDVDNAKLRKALLSVYLGPDSVTPDLVEGLAAMAQA